MMDTGTAPTPITEQFNASSECQVEESPDVAKTFSLRLYDSERTFLEHRAGRRPLSVYIRSELLKDMHKPRKASRKPSVDDKTASLILAELGKSRLASNMNQLAKSANMGTLDVSLDTEKELLEACAAIYAMRDALLIALKIKPQGNDQ